MALAMFYNNLFDSPYVVPVAGCVMILGIVGFGVLAGIRDREMQSQERLAAIAKGVPIPPTATEIALMHGKPAADLARRQANIRLAGIVLLFSAAGLILTSIALAVVLQQRYVLCAAAAALIPLGIGIGFLVDTRIQSRKLEESSSTGSPSV